MCVWESVALKTMIMCTCVSTTTTVAVVDPVRPLGDLTPPPSTPSLHIHLRLRLHSLLRRHATTVAPRT